MNVARNDRSNPLNIKYTPWGKAQEYNTDTLIAPNGVIIAAFVSTNGHGGVKVTKEGKKFLPKGVRKSWFEEDAEAALIRFIFADWLVQAGIYTPADGAESLKKHSMESLERYLPDWRHILEKHLFNIQRFGR